MADIMLTENFVKAILEKRGLIFTCALIIYNIIVKELYCIIDIEMMNRKRTISLQLISTREQEDQSSEAEQAIQETGLHYSKSEHLGSSYLIIRDEQQELQVYEPAFQEISLQFNQLLVSSQSIRTLIMAKNNQGRGIQGTLDSHSIQESNNASSILAQVQLRLNNHNDRIQNRLEEQNRNLELRFNNQNDRIDGVKDRLEERNRNLELRLNTRQGLLEDFKKQLKNQNGKLEDFEKQTKKLKDEQSIYFSVENLFWLIVFLTCGLLSTFLRINAANSQKSNSVCKVKLNFMEQLKKSTIEIIIGAIFLTILFVCVPKICFQARQSQWKTRFGVLLYLIYAIILFKYPRYLGLTSGPQGTEVCNYLLSLSEGNSDLEETQEQHLKTKVYSQVTSWTQTILQSRPPLSYQYALEGSPGSGKTYSIKRKLHELRQKYRQKVILYFNYEGVKRVDFEIYRKITPSQNFLERSQKVNVLLGILQSFNLNIGVKTTKEYRNQFLAGLKLILEKKNVLLVFDELNGLIDEETFQDLALKIQTQTATFKKLLKIIYVSTKPLLSENFPARIIKLKIKQNTQQQIQNYLTSNRKLFKIQAKDIKLFTKASSSIRQAKQIITECSFKNDKKKCIQSLITQKSKTSLNIIKNYSSETIKNICSKKFKLIQEAILRELTQKDYIYDRQRWSSRMVQSSMEVACKKLKEP